MLLLKLNCAFVLRDLTFCVQFVAFQGDDDGLFTKESVCEAVKIVMDDENEVGKEVRANHAKLRNFLLSKNLESSCIDSFCKKLYDLL